MMNKHFWFSRTKFQRGDESHFCVAFFTSYMKFFLLCVLLGSAVVESRRHVMQHDSLEEAKAWHCEVCRVFCIEYEEKIAEKYTDDHYDIAIDLARGNSSRYRWDARRRVLRDPLQTLGVEVVDEIYDEIDNNILSTSYVRDVILHALQAAAHLDVPTKLPALFCRRVLCEERLRVCEPHPDRRPFATLSRNYQHLLHTFDRGHHESEIHHPLSRFHEARSDVLRGSPHSVDELQDLEKQERQRRLDEL